ncbi:MAG TPA: FtsQ-type POTRA domain-containing protein [Candidatus Paceibacterota bacterium]|jgi:hypothetical protein|nr:FtsQ-type POTRA domain-containing protein [Candidatus Paceibacterota bacterium]
MYERTYHKTVLKDDEKESKKKEARVNWKLLLRITVAIVIIAAIIFVIRIPRAQVTHITVEGAKVVDPGDITEFIQQNLQGKELFVLPKSSIFLVPIHKLEKRIKQQFSRVQTVSINRVNFNTLSVSITEYQGVYLWCIDESTCYFMDQNGVAFTSAPYFSGDAYPKIFSGSMQNIPFQAVTSAQLADISLLLDRLATIGITANEFHFNSIHELDVDFTHEGRPAVLMFDPTTSISDALTDLYTGLRTNPLATKYRDTSKVLQYIDLRFSNRVVYKFQ